MQAFTPDPPRIDPDNLRTVGFTRRLLAALIDVLVTLPLAYAIYYFSVAVPNLSLVLALATADALYKPVLEKLFGATVGKQVLRMRVVSRNGFGNMDWNQTFLRYLPWAIVFFASVFVTIRQFQDPAFIEVQGYRAYIEYVRDSPLGDSGILAFLQNVPIIASVWMVGDRLNRGLHDRLALTLVVDLRVSE